MSDDPGILRSFPVVLAEVEDGRFAHEITEQMRALLKALDEAGGANGAKVKGSLTLTLNFAAQDGSCDVTADYKVKAPKLARGRSVFWVTPEFNLTRQNPRQERLPFRDVSVPSARGLA